MTSIPFIKGDKVDDNTDYRDALPVNYYAVKRDVKGDQGYMLNFYGLSKLNDGQGVSRGAIWVARTTFEGHYRVSGQKLIKVENDKSITVIGNIPGSDQCSMTYSLNNLAIVSSKSLYYYSPSKGLRKINDVNIGPIIDIVWADFKFVGTDGENLFQSNATNEEEYEPLDFSGSDFQPDKIRGVGLNEDNELVAFNELTTEYFVNSGADNFSYTRIQLKAVKAGIAGTHAKAEFKDKWYALTRRSSTQYQFSVIQSGSSESITTREIEKLLSKYDSNSLSKTIVEVFTKDSTVWMIAHLPDITLAYNQSIASIYGNDLAWSIIKSDVIGERSFRAKDLVFDPDLRLWCIGDKINSNIGYLDDSVCTQYEDIVEGLLFTPAIDLESLSINKLEIETIPGISPDNDATVFVSHTEDLRIYGQEWTEEYGLNLDYNNNFELRRLGYVRKHIAFKIRTASRSRMAFSRFDIEAS